MLPQFDDGRRSLPLPERGKGKDGEKLESSQERFRRPSGRDAKQHSGFIWKECGTRTRVIAHRLRLAMAEPPFISGFWISGARVAERFAKWNSYSVQDPAPYQ